MSKQDITSIAAFRRALAPGTIVNVTGSRIVNVTGSQSWPLLDQYREVRQVNSRGVAMTVTRGGETVESWITWPRADEITFRGGGVVDLHYRDGFCATWSVGCLARDLDGAADTLRDFATELAHLAETARRAADDASAATNRGEALDAATIIRTAFVDLVEALDAVSDDRRPLATRARVAAVLAEHLAVEIAANVSDETASAWRAAGEIAS